MSFLDKLFRWKKKPFGGEGDKSGRSGKGGKGKETPGSSATSATSATPERSSGQYAHVLLRPHTSEKAVSQGAQNQYVFEIAPQAGKDEVKMAIRDLYGIAPEQINIVNMSGKQTRFGKTTGATKGWKKAIITLPSGKTIDVYKK